MVIVALTGGGVFPPLLLPPPPPQPAAANATNAIAATSSRGRIRCFVIASQTIPRSPISSANHSAGGHRDAGPAGSKGAAATPVVVTVIVELPLAVPDSATDAGANEQASPGARPEQLSATVPVNPLLGVSVSGKLALAPWATVSVAVLTDMVNPPPVAPTVTTTAAEVDGA